MTVIFNNSCKAIKQLAKRHDRREVKKELKYIKNNYWLLGLIGVDLFLSMAIE